jgi:hypothetical protein
MSTQHRRKLVLAAMLATGLSASALANDTATTTQQTAVGQGAAELAAAQDAPLVVNENYATATAGPVAAPRARPKVTEPRPVVSSVRQPYGGGEYRAAPLILGIRH